MPPRTDDHVSSPRPPATPVPSSSAPSAQGGGTGQAPPPFTTAHGSRALTDVVTRLRRALRASIRTDYPWESLPMAQVELLQTLAEQAPARIGDLAAQHHLAPSTVSGLIGQMITAGLVIRDTDSSDRRAARVALTDAGHRQLADWQRAHEQRIGRALDQLDAEERAAIDRALPALAHLVENLNDV